MGPAINAALCSAERGIPFGRAMISITIAKAFLEELGSET
jgi:hypothetical protein